MSIKTWKLEFYPAPATVARYLGTNGIQGPVMHDPVDATRHCLRKWQGLTTENLRKHGLHIERAEIFKASDFYLEKPLLRLSSDNCALCQMYMSKYVNSCSQCPITKSRGGVPCDDEWGTFCMKDDPQPMIALLQSTLEYLTKE